MPAQQGPVGAHPQQEDARVQPRCAELCWQPERGAQLTKLCLKVALSPAALCCAAWSGRRLPAGAGCHKRRCTQAICAHLSCGCLRRLLRQAAAQAAGQRIAALQLGSGETVHLSSRLVRELCNGMSSLEIYSPAPEHLHHLPSFLDATSITSLHVWTRTSVQAVQADQFLPRCCSITALYCHLNFLPHLFPPPLQRLDVMPGPCWGPSQQQVLLVRLQAVPTLRSWHLGLATAWCCRPAWQALCPPAWRA